MPAPLAIPDTIHHVTQFERRTGRSWLETRQLTFFAKFGRHRYWRCPKSPFFLDLVKVAIPSKLSAVKGRSSMFLTSERFGTKSVVLLSRKHPGGSGVVENFKPPGIVLTSMGLASATTVSEAIPN
jgi:hypothetical protein